MRAFGRVQEAAHDGREPSRTQGLSSAPQRPWRAGESPCVPSDRRTPLLVPGLLQIEDYSRSLIEAALTKRSPAEVEKRVRAWMVRQTLLGRPDAPQFHVVIGEAVLHQETGGREVLHEQLRKILDVISKRPNVTLQVMPFSAGAIFSNSSRYRRTWPREVRSV